MISIFEKRLDTVGVEVVLEVDLYRKRICAVYGVWV